MKPLLSLVLLLACLLPCGAADKTIHQLNPGVTAADGDRFPIDRYNGATWNNYYLTVSDLKAQFNIVTNVTYTTNNYVWSTNYFINNSYVSNYFMTNVYSDTYMSNFYQTNFYTTNNTWNYSSTTNIFTTNLVTEYSYPSNFFATNIFVTDNTVSNFFLTNITYWTTNFNISITTNVFVGQTNAFILDQVNTATAPSNTFNGDVYINGQLYVNSTSTNTIFGGNVSAEGIFYGNGGGLTNLDGVRLDGTNMWTGTNTWSARSDFDDGFNAGAANQLTVDSSGVLTLSTLNPNTLVIANAFSALNSLGNGSGILTNDGSGVFGWTHDLILTNIYVTNITAKNMTVNQINVITNYANLLTVTNQIMWVTNTWAGPTNEINIGGPYDQNYATVVPCSITGFTNKPSYTTAEVLLSIYNTSASNITVTLPANVADGDYTLSHTITNATTGYFWIRYTPVGPRTNCVFRQM